MPTEFVGFVVGCLYRRADPVRGRCNSIRMRGTNQVWRAFFFAVGAMMVIVGIECLMIDSATFASEGAETVQVNNSWFGPPETMQIASQKTIKPAEWIPWSLIASGAVVILYALTLPKRWGAAK